MPSVGLAPISASLLSDVTIVAISAKLNTKAASAKTATRSTIQAWRALIAACPPGASAA